MSYRLPLIFLLLCTSPAWADFSDTRMFHHPLYIEQDAPFILDFRGEWPTDCHPGEQKPVISEYTGDTVLIEFEIIVEHVTCNDTPTPYRVLVDMSDVVDDVPGDFMALEVTVRFGGGELVKTLDKLCLMCDPPPPPYDIKPEPGLYEGAGLQKQGLLLARQNDRMGVYPLVYDESGNSQWLFGGGGVVEDVYFVKLKELYGGQCLGCPPPDDPPQKEVVGKLSMLMDSEGVIQVKVNGGLFTEYRPVEFGYGTYAVTDPDGSGGPNWIPNLAGRWALADDNSDLWGETSPLPSEVLPLVFDIEEGLYRDPPLPVITPPPPSHVAYSIRDIAGEVVAEIECGYVIGEMLCDLKSPNLDQFDHWFRVQAVSVERLLMTNMLENFPDDGTGAGQGTAVRID